MRKLFVLSGLIIALAACTGTNAQVLNANATAKAIGATATALGPRLGTAEADAAFAATFFQEIMERDQLIGGLYTAMPHCKMPAGEIRTWSQLCVSFGPTVSPVTATPGRLTGNNLCELVWEGVLSNTVWEALTASQGSSEEWSIEKWFKEFADDDAEPQSIAWYLRSCLNEGWHPSGPTATPLPPTDRTKAETGAGAFMVGSEIAPGVWRSSGTGVSSSGSCWIEIKNFDGDTVTLQADPPGSTIRIPAGDLIVVMGGGGLDICIWNFLQP